VAVHTADPFTPTLLLLAGLWLAAKLGGELAIRLRLPAVSGELGVGLALAALQPHAPWIPDLAGSPEATLLANLGVVVLMFSVGLESTVPQMIRTGLASLRVAVLGVLAPTALCLAGTRALLPKDSPFIQDLFIAACLCATSIGISVQVLRERKAEQSTEGRIIVGAAVLDDVLGLLVLVAVSSVAMAAEAGASLPWGRLNLQLGLAIGFLGLALSLGRAMTPVLFQMANRLRSEELLLPVGLALAFGLAYLGSLAGLAPIVGAYAAGLILEPASIGLLQERERKTLEEVLHPLVVVLAPLFFVQMGAKVDPQALLSPMSIGLALVLTVLGVLGKWVAGFGAGRGARPGVVGWGMVPRGEVGLIFVAIGSTLGAGGGPILPPAIKAGVVGAILLTTMLGPLGLSWALRRGRAEA
jgi:Kef-type K+ transport system membrane component KefB